MTALVQAFSRLWSVDIETDKPATLLMLCGAGLFVSLLLASYGVDLGAEFF